MEALPRSSDLPPASGSPPYADRSTGLLIFGILEIIGGALALFAIPLMILGLVIGRKAGGSAPLTSFITVPVTYGCIAAILLVLGIGATQAKRWAWALNLILSWMWMIFGVLVTGIVTFVLPKAMLSSMRIAAARTPNPAAPPAGVMAVIITLMIAFLAIFCIVLPLAFLLFYKSKNVELTCKTRDPKERWTDRVPLPVLAYALMAVAGALYYPVIALTTPLMPFFGRYLTGIPAGIAFMVLALVDAAIAILFFRKNVLGWWLAVISLGLRIVSAALTFGHGNLLDAYSRIGWSERQINQLRVNPMFRGDGMLWFGMLFLVIYFVFVLWLKRYFRSTPATYAPPTDPVANSTAVGF